MGAFLAKPQTSKHTDSGSGNGLRYGLSSMQGWRVEMEDAHCAAVRLQPPSMADWSFFAIFDGHAGARVSALCAEQLLESIVSNDDFRADATPGGAATWQPSSESVQRGIKTGFLRLDASMRKLPEVESGEDKSGSTAVCCLVSPRHIFFGNCGDSRAVLSRAGQVVFATRDHKPADPEERARIQNAGGSVMLQRVNGSLAVSRALGDYDYKNVAGRGPCEQLVSPEPEVSVEERATRDDEFAVLACDGIWDVMSNEELAAFVRDRMRLTDDLAHVCNQVVDTCLYKVLLHSGPRNPCATHQAPYNPPTLTQPPCNPPTPTQPPCNLHNITPTCVTDC